MTGDERIAEFRTTDSWDEELWQEAEAVYLEAFPKGSKSRTIIRGVLDKQIGSLHVAFLQERAVAMALTGMVKTANVLLIDYLAVREELRGEGIGRSFLEYLKDWAARIRGLDGIVIEVESEPSPENERRIRFWEMNGFTLTDYVHHYIWVPEPYRAMYLKLHQAAVLPEDGQALFRFITQFHMRAYRGSK